ncbi:MAG: class I SAM-dependent methyltransferase [Phycisphaerae bacterium]|nr:class I SAM-dependent methyltransferase [Phycisphaerae bacterium]
MSQSTDLGNGEDLRVALPEPSLRLTQDSEWCLVETADGWREFRFHDYADIYDVPGLYEKIFYDILECDSPVTVRQLLQQLVESEGIAPANLRVLDLGAGNGMVGAEIADMGVKTIVGVDIVDAAREATLRDRPGVYTDYLVADMTKLGADQRRALKDYRFNCLTCVAALGFGDIPPLAFAEAYRLIDQGGLVAFNIKEAFLRGNDSSGFSRLIRCMIKDGILSVSHQIAYQHRVATSGDPLQYVAIVGRKNADIPAEIVEELEQAA